MEKFNSTKDFIDFWLSDKKAIIFKFPSVEKAKHAYGSLQQSRDKFGCDAEVSLHENAVFIERKADKEIRIPCPACGTLYAPYINKMYCSKECQWKTARERKRERRKLGVHYEPPVKKEKKRPNDKLTQMANEAAALGLTYGQYAAMKERGAVYETREGVIRGA